MTAGVREVWRILAVVIMPPVAQIVVLRGMPRPDNTTLKSHANPSLSALWHPSAQATLNCPDAVALEALLTEFLF